MFYNLIIVVIIMNPTIHFEERFVQSGMTYRDCHFAGWELLRNDSVVSYRCE